MFAYVCLPIYVYHMYGVVCVYQKSMLDPDTVAIDCCEPHEVGMGTRLPCSANAAGAVNSLANAPEPDI